MGPATSCRNRIIMIAPTSRMAIAATVKDHPTDGPHDVAIGEHPGKGQGMAMLKVVDPENDDQGPLDS